PALVRRAGACRETCPGAAVEDGEAGEEPGLDGPVEPPDAGEVLGLGVRSLRAPLLDSVLRREVARVEAARQVRAVGERPRLAVEADAALAPGRVDEAV